MKEIQQHKLTRLEQRAFKVTHWIGGVPSLIIHTILFASAFVFYLFGTELDTVLLVLTTLVSLEAIYLAIFIQMTVNYNTRSLQEVEENIDEIQEDVEEISQDVEEISEDVEEISEDVEEISEDVEELTDDVEGLLPEETDTTRPVSLEDIRGRLQQLLRDLDNLK